MLEQLEPIVQEYSYGKTHLIGRNMEIIIDEDDKVVLITDFHKTGLNIREGDCYELTVSLQMRLQQEMTDLYSIAIRGNDPHIFSAPQGCHWYLVASENEHLLYARCDDFNDQNFLKKVKPIVLDPSFKFVGYYALSGYTVWQISTEMDLTERIAGCLLCDGGGTPLGITRRGTIIFLLADFSHPEVLMISQKQTFGQESSIQCYLMGASVIRDILRFDFKLQELVDYLHIKNPLRGST